MRAVSELARSSSSSSSAWFEYVLRALPVYHPYIRVVGPALPLHHNHTTTMSGWWAQRICSWLRVQTWGPICKSSKGGDIWYMRVVGPRDLQLVPAHTSEPGEYINR